MALLAAGKLQNRTIGIWETAMLNCSNLALVPWVTGVRKILHAIQTGIMGLRQRIKIELVRKLAWIVNPGIYFAKTPRPSNKNACLQCSAADIPVYDSGFLRGSGGLRPWVNERIKAKRLMSLRTGYCWPAAKLTAWAIRYG